MSAPGAPHAIFTARSMSAHNRAEMRTAFDHALKLAERNRLTLRVPHESKAVQNKRGMHYHYRPEIFLGLQGTTHFSFPREGFHLGPDDLCIIPAGVPHGEVVQPGPDKPFRNLVAGFYNNTLSLHFAHEVRPGKPDIEVIEFFDAPNLDVFLTLANTTAQTHSMQGPAREAVLKGLQLALLGLFRNIVETGTGQAGVVVGDVEEVVTVTAEQLEAVPSADIQTIESIAKIGDRLVILLNPEGLFAGCGVDELAAA